MSYELKEVFVIYVLINDQYLEYIKVFYISRKEMKNLVGNSGQQVRIGKLQKGKLVWLIRKERCFIKLK